MATTTSDLHESILVTAEDIAALLRAGADPAVRVPDSDWSVGEAAAHLALANGLMADLAAGVSRPYGDGTPVGLAAANAASLAAFPERSPEVLAEAIVERARAFCEAADAGSAAGPLLSPMGPMEPEVLGSYLLTHMLGHGWDLARALRRPHMIDRERVLLCMPFVATAMPRALDPVAVAGLTARPIPGAPRRGPAAAAVRRGPPPGTQVVAGGKAGDGDRVEGAGHRGGDERHAQEDPLTVDHVHGRRSARARCQPWPSMWVSGWEPAPPPAPSAPSGSTAGRWRSPPSAASQKARARSTIASARPSGERSGGRRRATRRWPLPGRPGCRRGWGGSRPPRGPPSARVAHAEVRRPPRRRSSPSRAPRTAGSAPPRGGAAICLCRHHEMGLFSFTWWAAMNAKPGPHREVALYQRCRRPDQAASGDSGRPRWSASSAMSCGLLRSWRGRRSQQN